PFRAGLRAGRQGVCGGRGGGGEARVVSVIDELKWDERGLIPAVVQDTETGQLLMVAWMSAESLQATQRTGLTHFWSRSRESLWRKRGTSGHSQHADGIYADGARDRLLVPVHQDAGAT